jgi:predicted lipase
MPPTGENPSYSQTTETTTESLAVLQAETQQQEAQIKRQEERNAALEKTTNLDVAGQLKRDQERLLTR